MPAVPPHWSVARLTGDAEESILAFREDRIAESGQIYADLYAESYHRAGHVLNVTSDLLSLANNISQLIQDGYYDVLRYLPAPPISADDLATVAELTTTHSSRKLALPENADSICDFVLRSIDLRRFVWLADSRRPTPHEKETALVATASLLSTQQLQTMRRNLAKKNQESRLKHYLINQLQYKEVPTRRIATILDAPRAREFCGETPVANKKADVVIGLGDNRFMCIECKVSNSKVNSFKRLNHETVEKTTHWYSALGTNSVVCTGLLSGVFSVGNLLLAQKDGVSIFWSHDLHSLGAFIELTFGKDAGND